MNRRMGKLAGALLTGLAVVLLTAAAARADVNIDARIEIRPHPSDDLRIWIWPDRGEGAEYYPGDGIRINVEANRDCFLILYDIDTRGNLRILYPYDPWDNNFIEGGRVISFPRDWDGYEWTVDGPPGIEYVQAIASEFPISPPDWPIYIRSVNHGGAICHDPELRDFRAGGDRFDYIGVVNRKITGRYWDYCATDLATFYVQRRYHGPVIIHRPWPDIYYGEIYIGWPIGGRIYIDGVYVGIAPLWIPRHHGHGQHVVVCRLGDREVRRQTIQFYGKKDYRYKGRSFGETDVIISGNVKPARRGGLEVFRTETERDHKDRRDKVDKRSERDSRWTPEVNVDRERTVERERTATRQKGDDRRTVTVDNSAKRTVDTEQKAKPETKKRGWLESAATSISKTISKSKGKSEARADKQASDAKPDIAAGRSAQKVEKKEKAATRANRSEDGKTAKRSGGRIK